MTLWGCCIESPIGPLTIAVDDRGAAKCLHFGRVDDPDMRDDSAAIAPMRTQLEEYFAGERRAFDLELDPEGTVFQRDVWRALVSIPYGQTASYGELAERAGRPGAFRAVGAANGANPIAIIIPCHRIIGSDGSLTGFGGGIETKAALLALEGVIPRDRVTAADRKTRITRPA